MDLYFIKIKARSKGTAEDIVGYFFGKTNGSPDFDFVVVPVRYSNLIDDITLEENLNEFKEKLEKIKQKIKENQGIYDITLAFAAYLNNIMNRRGKIPLGIEFSTAVKEEDADVLKVITSDLFEEWSPKMEITVKFQGMLLEEYSALTFFDIREDFSDENIVRTYSRADIVDLVEVFPVIDPINGTSILQFDVGDKIPVVILNPGKHDKQLREKFPDYDSKRLSLEATMISKELVKVKGGNIYLVKVEIFEGVYAKALVSPALKILSDENYLLKKRRQNMEGKEKGRQDIPRQIKVEVPPTTGSELIVAFMTTFLITGAMLIIIYILSK